MDSAKLKQDLSNSLINFDRQVLITQLLDDYKCSYEEVCNIVTNFLAEQEKKDKMKYEKKYLIYGTDDGEIRKEIFKIVEEAQLKEWLKKLQNAESALYSVEVAGGSKSVVSVFKPMSVANCVQSNRLKRNKSATDDIVDTSALPEDRQQEKRIKSEISDEIPKSVTKTTDTAKKTSPKPEISPKEGKTKTDKKATVKKGINTFFAPSSTTASIKSEDTNHSKASPNGVKKPTTPKKMQDFFKQQMVQPKNNAEIVDKKAVNTSVQLFDESDKEDEEEESSSDEEDKLEVLKRNVISSDVELEDDDENKQSTSVKRRRILDSEDEEDPPLKQEKLDIKDEKKEEEAVAETYLDEDGFVITKKPKQKAVKIPAKTPKPAPVTLKPSPKETKRSNPSVNKAASTSTAKTKQAGIMNFFSKK